MLTESTLISFATDTNSTSNDIVLEQVAIPDAYQSADLTDLSKMWSYVTSGKSARAYKKDACPIAPLGEGRVAIPLDFYVWPPSMDLAYTLSAEMGEISGAARIELHVEFDLVFEVVDSVELDYLFEGTCSFETPAITALGTIVDNPTITISGRQILSDKKVFCVLRVAGVAIGYQHTVTVEFDVVEDNKIIDLNNAIIAAWVDEDGQSQNTTLDIEFPDCVSEFLELCPDGILTVGGGVEQPVPIVFWSGCSTSFLGVRYEWQ